MKKRLYQIGLALMAALMLSIGLVACGGGTTGGSGSFVGTYGISSMTMNGVTIEGSTMQDALASIGGTDGNKLEILDDKNLRLTFQGQSFSLPYTQNGNNLHCEDASGKFDLTVDGNKVTLDIPAQLAGAGNTFIMVFTKV